MQPSRQSGMKFGEEGDMELPLQAMLPGFTRLRQRVTWINANDDRASKEFAVTYQICYGNEGGHLGWVHTELAMLVHVPASRRGQVRRVTPKAAVQATA